MAEKRFRSIKGLAIIALFCINLIPTYHWLEGLKITGLLPTLECLEGSRIGPWVLVSIPIVMLKGNFSGSYGDWWPVLFLLFGSIPLLIILKGCRENSRKKCLTGATIGCTGMLLSLIGFIVKHGSLYYPNRPFKIVFDFDECSVGFGFWIVLLIHLICIIIASNIKEK